MVARWKVITAATVIFLAGAATGGMLARTYAPKVVRRMHVSPPLPMSTERRMEYIAKLDRELQLTPEQRRQAEQIITASQERMKALWEPFEPQVKEEYRRSRREISDILNPEQKEKMKQWRERFKEGGSRTNWTNSHRSNSSLTQKLGEGTNASTNISR